MGTFKEFKRKAGVSKQKKKRGRFELGKRGWNSTWKGAGFIIKKNHELNRKNDLTREAREGGGELTQTKTSSQVGNREEWEERVFPGTGGQAF